MTPPFIEKIRALADRVPIVVEHLKTEEATKNALIMPFIAALGYDVFNPLEVVPEFVADVGTKKGEKVDYAIKRGDEVIILVEAKPASKDLCESHMSQLYRYFSVTKARIALLTNGVLYHFYSDLDEPNKMDAKPFLEIDLCCLKDELLVELGKLAKDAFNLETMLAAATDLKYLREIRRVFESELKEPSEELVRLFYARVNPTGRFVQAARETFTRLVNQGLNKYISDKVSDTLRAAIERPRPPDPPEPQPTQPDASNSEDGIVTTEEELEGFRIVKTIASSVMPADRIGWRDTRNHFLVLVDDNNRRPICKLHFNRPQKYIGLFDEARNETKHPIASVDGIYTFAEQLRETARRYLHQGTMSKSEKSDGVVESPPPSRKILFGKTFVFTGTLPTLERDIAAKMVTDAGGTVVNTVSKGTNYVVVGADPGSKLERANKVGAKTIDESAFRELFNEAD